MSDRDGDVAARMPNDPHVSASRLDSLSATYRRCLFGSILPLWSGAGVNHGIGGFEETLSADGPDPTTARRVRVTARQIYSFHEASRLGWNEAAASVCVQHGYRFLLAHTSAEGLLLHTLKPTGEILERGYDLYDQAFLLFAYAHAYRLLGDEDIATRARYLLSSIRTNFAGGDGGFHSRAGVASHFHANPHMHLLEAGLAWYASDSDPLWQSLAGEIVALFADRFFDRRTGAVIEDFRSDWKPISVGDRFRVEPGHLFEWAWLLMRWETLTKSDCGDLPRRLITFAEQYGYDFERRVAVNEIWSDRSIKDANARLWPQTERLKAWLSLAEREEGRSQLEAEALAADAASALLLYLEKPGPGLWHDVMLPNGEFQTGNSPASSLYHIICAAGELLRYAEESSSADKAK